MDIQIIVEVITGKVYESVPQYGVSDRDVVQLLEILGSIKDLNKLYIETESGKTYFNPNHIVSVTLKEIK